MNWLKSLKILTSVGPTLKSWIFADGKFSPKRALILLITLVVLFLGIHFIGVENVTSAVDMLDEVSDVIGYEE